MFCIFGFEGIFFITTDPFPISGQIKSFVEKSPAGLSDRGGGGLIEIPTSPPPKGCLGSEAALLMELAAAHRAGRIRIVCLCNGYAVGKGKPGPF